MADRCHEGWFFDDHEWRKLPRSSLMHEWRICERCGLAQEHGEIAFVGIGDWFNSTLEDYQRALATDEKRRSSGREDRKEALKWLEDRKR